MLTQNNTKEKIDVKKSYQEFNKFLMVLLVIGILIISGFVIFALLTPESGYITYGLLNADRRAENYPTNTTVGENITFYVSFGNYLNRDFSFRIELLKGDNETVLLPTGSVNATSYLNTSTILLPHGNSWISDAFNISFTQPGDNQTIIAELWETNIGPEDKFWEIAWMRLNVTS
jgi:uncharacterized membrane protein